MLHLNRPPSDRPTLRETSGLPRMTIIPTICLAARDGPAGPAHLIIGLTDRHHLAVSAEVTSAAVSRRAEWPPFEDSRRRSTVGAA
jgi:hypothetical protein